MNLNNKFAMEQAWRPVLKDMPVNSIQMIDSSMGICLVIFAEEELVREFLYEEEPLMLFHFHTLDLKKEVKLAINYNEHENAIEKKGNVFETVMPNNSKTKKMIGKLKNQQFIPTTFFTPHESKGYEFRRNLAFPFDKQAHYDFLKYY